MPRFVDLSTRMRGEMSTIRGRRACSSEALFCGREYAHARWNVHVSMVAASGAVCGSGYAHARRNVHDPWALGAQGDARQPLACTLPTTWLGLVVALPGRLRTPRPLRGTKNGGRGVGMKVMTMSGPAWLGDIFASLTLLVALSSAGRLVLGPRWARLVDIEADFDHLLMGVAMAGMFVASLDPLPSVAWESIFSLVAVWFAWRCVCLWTGRSVRSAASQHHVVHYPTHLVMALAMLYMYFAGASAVGPTGGGTATASGELVGLPLLFLIVLVASGIWELDWAEWLRRPRVVPVTAAVREYAVVGYRASSPAEPPGGVGDATPESPPPSTEGSLLLAPGIATAAHVVMCLAMAYMLIVML